jgi:transcriptional regulator with XRE-family HTH domain
MAPNTALKTAIFSSGTTQTAVSQKTGIHESRLSRIVRGHIDPTNDEKRAIARALRRQVSDFFPPSEVTA